MAENYALEHIRIGTLVDGGPKTAEYIQQILPYGFESFGINFCQTLGKTDLQKAADEVKRVIEGSGAKISCLGIFGNPLENEETDKLTREAWMALIDAAALFDCDMVAGFTGRLRGKPIHESVPRFKEVFTRICECAGSKGVRIAFENCHMGGNWESGDWNIAHNPVAWEMMFEAVDMDNIGLQWEPCHQMVSLIEPLPQLKQWVGKIFNVHGKDATVHWDVIRKYGVHSSLRKIPSISSNVKFAPAYVEQRTPGFGDSNWCDIITELRRGGFRGSIDIEGGHDPIYRGELEMTGQVSALNYLKRCRGGNFVPNPSV